MSTIRHVRCWPDHEARRSPRAAFWVADSPIRWTSLPAAARQPLERQRQVRAALGRGDRVDLVDDHRLRRPRTARCARPVSIRYSDSGVVIRMSGGWRSIALALALRRVAGPDGDRQLGADPAQRRAEVAVDVVGERLQRRDVDEARSRRSGPARPAAGQPVDRPQERRQRLARAGRRRDQHVLAGRDRRPRLRLRRRRRRRTRR